MAAKRKATKTKYTKKELKEFKKVIDAKLVLAREQLEFYMVSLAETADSGDSKVKGLDDGVSTMESQRLNTLAGRQKKHIAHLENALLRIQNGVYGVCRETGRLITRERLLAVPHATLSIHAKQAK